MSQSESKNSPEIPETSSDKAVSSGMQETGNKIFASLVALSIALFIAGSLILYMTTRPYHLWFIGFVLLFALFETATLSRRIHKHIHYVELLPVVLTAFVVAFAAGLGLLFISVKIIGILAPINLILFIIFNLLLVFLSDFIHTLITLEFIKKMLRVKIGPDFKENLLIAKSIAPGKQAVLSGLRSIVSTMVILISLAFLLTLAVMHSAVPAFDDFATMPVETMQIQDMELTEYTSSLPVLQEVQQRHKEWNEEIVTDREAVLEKREQIPDSLLKATLLMITGELFTTIKDAQQFASSINNKFYSAVLDSRALNDALKQAISPRNPREGFSVDEDQLIDLTEDVESQYLVFEDNKDKKFRALPKIDELQTELGTIDLKKILPDPESADASILGRLYTKMFQGTALYLDSQQVMEAFQGTRLHEKGLIEEIYGGMTNREADQSRYVRLHLLLRHLVYFNIGYCNNLEEGRSECLKTGKLINTQYCGIIEDSDAYDICVS